MIAYQTLKNTSSRHLRKAAKQAGFTVIELIAVLGLMAIILSIGTGKFGTMMGQMKAAQDIRQLSMTLGYARDEAVRLRANVRVGFTTSAITIDLYDDNSIDQTINLSKASTWSPSTPSSILFNGLGLARGIATSSTLSIKNRNIVQSLSVNKNGYVSL